ncbi:MAG: adenylate kinase [Planctomycetota bacterium]|nr:adenylate kinase [Planctomycetota bacterium]
MRVVFIGPPGAGKGTQSQRLLKYLQVPHISTGDLLREAVRNRTNQGLLAEKYMSEGCLVPDPVMIDLVGKRLDDPDCLGGCLLDGFPRTLGQAQALDRYLTEHSGPLDGVLELKVNENVLIQRLAGRGRSDDEPKVIRQRFRTYRDRTEPLLEYYRVRGLLESIDGIGTQDEVFDRIRQALTRLGERIKSTRGA